MEKNIEFKVNQNTFGMTNPTPVKPDIRKVTKNDGELPSLIETHKINDSITLFG